MSYETSRGALYPELFWSLMALYRNLYSVRRKVTLKAKLFVDTVGWVAWSKVIPKRKDR